MNLFHKTHVADNRTCGLYLIDSGKNDDVYKIGITSNPQHRIEDIRTDYSAPDAFYLGFVELPSRDKALALETDLHSQYEQQRCAHMTGWEWFTLTLEDVEDIVQANDLKRYSQ